MHDGIGQDREQEFGLEIAVIGMAGRFSGTKSIDEFWNNIKNSIESITFFADDELINSGINSRAAKNPDYVKANGCLEDFEYFDASFFGYLPVDVEIMDPQVRIFHECVWEALENSGYDPDSYKGLIGLYAGASMNNYWIGDTVKLGTGGRNSFTNSLFFDKDFLTTRVSYKLNLKGASSTVFTACSTSLVAVHQACQGLLSSECTIALAGGVSVITPQEKGYLYQEGLIYSPDGHCRAFDARANGTVFGSGVGIVVLKQLEEALDHRDTIYAVIKGSAINNDGSQKVGFTAPSVKGQAAVIRAAHAAAEINPGSIGYIETHGTGTDMGDPIEIEALTRAFHTDKKGFCAVSSVKPNVGHLDTAAGIASFIKTVLILKHKIIPPALHFETPNPKIDFANSPFYVSPGQKEWKRGKYPRRAGVSSFGIGGTNAHVILEEWPEDKFYKPSKSRKYQLILLSAKTSTALDRRARDLAEYLKEYPHTNLADAAYTMQAGRNAMEYRKILVCPNVNESIEAMSSPETGHVNLISKEDRNRTVVFMFPGQGAQYVDMGLDLYKTEPVFREETDHCFEILKSLMGYDIKEILYPATRNPQLATPSEKINQTEITQPLLFAFEYALAKLLMHWGIKPDAMIGHSIGEYVAAHLAGVFSLEDVLKLVVLRGQLMQRMPGGAMLSVPLSEKQLTPFLKEGISLAAVNGPSLCVVSGSHETIDTFAEELKEKGHEGRRLHTSHAYHSHMMDPVVEEFEEKVSRVKLNTPKIPYIANVTGKWITHKEVVSPGYWAAHLRKTVQFARGLKELLEKKGSIFVEVGPGQVLSTLVRKQAASTTEIPVETGEETNTTVINLIRHPKEEVSDSYYLLTKIGQLWLYGKSIDWSAFYSTEKRYRIPLPTYPFEGQRYSAALERETPKILPAERRALDQWFYIPSWKRSIHTVPDSPPAAAGTALSWLVFADSLGFGSQLVTQLEKEGRQVISVKIGTEFKRISDNLYTLNPHQSSDYDDLFEELGRLERFPGNILHLWNITGNNGKESLLEDLDNILDRGFYSLLSIAQAVGKWNFEDEVPVLVVTDNMQEVVGGELLSPQKAAVLGPVQVSNREYPNLRCRSIDIVLPSPGTRQEERLVRQLSAECLTGDAHPVIAYRDIHRWVRTYEPVRLQDPGEKIPRLKEKGVYLVTGGLGGIGLVLAEHLAGSVRARLILVGRSSFPRRQEWERWLEEHEEEDPVSLKIGKVKELEGMGAEVMVFSADVTLPEQMQEVITRSKEQFGGIDGVIHAAGMADGALIQLRTRQMSEEVLAPKIKGTLVLDHVLREEELDFFMLCSSFLSILAPMGQVGYCAANDFLDAFAFYKSHRNDTFTVSVNWYFWQEVGMVVNANTPKVSKFQHKKLSHHLFDKYMVNGTDMAVFVARLSVSKHWFLDEHRILGGAIVLGTVYLEVARAAFEVFTGHEAVEIREVYFLNPLMVGDDEEKELRVVLKKKKDYFEFFFVCPSSGRKDEWTPHARGEITAIDVSTAAESIKKYNIKDIETQCDSSSLSGLGSKPYETGLVDVGPRWDSLKEVKLGEFRGLGRFQLPVEYSGDIKSFGLHPALLDYATSYLVMTDKLINPMRGGYLPFSYKRLRMKGPLPTGMFGYSRFIENKAGKKETLSFDVTIMDEEGNELVEVEGFTMLTVTDEGKPIAQQVRARFPLPSYIPGVSGLPGASGVYPEGSLKAGIKPAEGVEVFDRIMGSSSLIPQVLVSTQDLESERERVGAMGMRSIPKESPQKQNKFTGTIQKRPQLSSVYVAPRDKTEHLLAETLENYLGIDQVGVNDNFFDLGASSLDLVQLSQKLTAVIETEIPVVNLFRFPMISLLAEYLSGEGRKNDTLKSKKEERRVEEVMKGRQSMQSRLELIKRGAG